MKNLKELQKYQISKERLKGISGSGDGSCTYECQQGCFGFGNTLEEIISSEIDCEIECILACEVYDI